MEEDLLRERIHNAALRRANHVLQQQLRDMAEAANRDSAQAAQAAQAALAACDAERSALEARLTALEASASWRLTRPLRAMSKLRRIILRR